MSNLLSIEESLKLLAPREEKEDINTERKAKRRIKTPTRSPVRIPKLSPVKKYSPREKIIPIGNESLYEEKEETKKEIAPHTPTRFSINTPRTPTANFDKLAARDIDLEEKIKEYRYSIIKYLVNEEENKILYIVCFDPNGQLIFIELDKKIRSKTKEEKTVKLIKQVENPVLGSYQNCLIEKLTGDVRGAVFYEKGGYLFADRQDDGEFNMEYYLLEEQQFLEEFNLSQTYLVINLSELETAPQYIMDNNKKNYQIIQQQQLISNKETFKHLIDSMDKLNKNIKNFEKVYGKYANNLVDDWGLLGTFSRDYYDKYSKGNLNKIDKEKFDKVSINMYARFQNFNEHILMIQNLLPLCGDINKVSIELKEMTDNIKTKDKIYSNRIIEIDEINNMV